MTSLSTKPSPTPNAEPLVGNQLPPAARSPMNSIREPLPEDSNHLSDHGLVDTHMWSVTEVPISPPGHLVCETQAARAGRGPILDDPFLGVLASTVDDLEGTRKATANRLGQLTRDKKDKDGHMRGLGLDESSPEVAMVAALLQSLEGVEHQAILRLNKQMRKHQLWKTWGIKQKGVGEKQLARLLAALGDPYWNDLHDRPRLVSELWAYSGFHVVHAADQATLDSHRTRVGGMAPKKVRGQKVNWSSDARMRVWNIVGSCIKSQGYYAEIYYDGREKYLTATHSQECVRCAPKGNPAPIGSDLSDAHKHARAMRLTSKEILKDLWIASRDLHQQD